MQQQFYEAAAKERESIECLIETNQVAEEKLRMQIKENNKNSEENPLEYEKLDENISNRTESIFTCLIIFHKTINKKGLSNFPTKGSFEDSLKAMRDHLTKDTLMSLGFK